MNNFHKRLLEACAANSEIPDYGKGQQTYLAEALGVSQEAVRKWFAGETTPRSSLSLKLSKILGCRHSWLMLGTSHEEINSDIQKARRHHSGVYGLMGYLVHKDVGATFEREAAHSDIMMIDQGVLKHLSVEIAIPVGAVSTNRKEWESHKDIDKDVLFVIFSEMQVSSTSTIVSVPQFDATRSVVADFIEPGRAVWDEFGKREGNSVTLEIRRNPRGFTYSAGGVNIKRFLEK